MPRNLMFREVTYTWNPVVGCLHGCRYCYARKLANTRLRHIYKNFYPRLIEERLDKVPKKGLVFVCSMGDLFGKWMASHVIERVFKAIIDSDSKATFLFLTKNPIRYHEFLDLYQDNMIFGATIETTMYLGAIYKGWYKPPSPTMRAYYMNQLPHYVRRFISIEPIMKLIPEIMVKWILNIKPEFVYIGYDNWNNRLPEPRVSETKKLIETLKEYGVDVRLKTIPERAWWEEDRK